MRRRIRVAVGVILVLAGLGYAVNAFVGIDTNLLWFRAIGHESAYTRRLWTEVLLFALFGALMAATIAFTLVVVVRFRPAFKPDPTRQRWRYLYSRLERRLRRWLFAIVVIVLGVQAGSAAASGWQTWLLWRNGVQFGQRDPQFHRDISYFLFIYPLHRMVLTLLFRIVGTAIVTLLVVGYAYGAVQLRRAPRLSRAARIHLSALLGVYFTLKAFGYWLDRMATATSNRGVVTGPSYTDIHAVIPGKLALVIVAGVCAAILFANVAVSSGRLIAVGIGVMWGCALVAGVILPKVVQQFWEKPSASVVERTPIARNIAGTLAAFGLDGDVTVTNYPGTPTLAGAALRAKAMSDAQYRLLDPNQLSPTFTVLQQQRSFYGFKGTLDVDRYPIDGKLQDVLIGLRELTPSGLPSSSWTNQHFVYTHGYGVVAAPTDSVTSVGVPVFIAGDIPQHGVPAVTVPQIYYGQSSPQYSIVGAAPGAAPREFDHPAAAGPGAVTTTHVGGGGVPIGGFFHRLLYALKLHSASVLFSSEINRDSQIIYNRNPRARVAAVAPWLTLDGDTYPVVVDGHVDWVVDGYTTSSNYPYSQQVNLRSATMTSLVKNGASVAQPSTPVNYMRNSVKAVVDAYSGAVTLYAWDQANHPDPVLQTWEKAFPGLVQPQSDIPAALLPHLRYPQDLFNVQRTLLAQYHVTDAGQFYSGSDFWKIPNDPTIAGGTRTNSVGKTVQLPSPPQPAAYLTMSDDGSGPATFSLSTPLVTLNTRNLAAFLSVNSTPGPDYGHFTLLELPSTSIVDAPSQIQNEIESTPRVATTLSLERTGGSRVVIGDLIAVPLAGQILYVEPIYTQSKGGSGYPILRHIAAVYGGGPVGFADTITAALDQALA